jgi:hypothetical protein
MFSVSRGLGIKWAAATNGIGRRCRMLVDLSSNMEASCSMYPWLRDLSRIWRRKPLVSDLTLACHGGNLLAVARRGYLFAAQN